MYEAKVYANGPDGTEVLKSGHGGKSTFFPDSWSKQKIKTEVEYAINNNKGIVPNGATNQYYGYSTDGKVKIEFYYNKETGVISSYFPSLNK